MRTAGLLKNVGGQRTMTAAGPTRSFGPPPEVIFGCFSSKPNSYRLSPAAVRFFTFFYACSRVN